MRVIAILTSLLIPFQLVSTSEAEAGRIQSPRSESELYLTQNLVFRLNYSTVPLANHRRCGKNEQLYGMLPFTFLLGQIQLGCLESTKRTGAVATTNNRWVGVNIFICNMY